MVKGRGIKILRLVAWDRREDTDICHVVYIFNKNFTHSYTVFDVLTLNYYMEGALSMYFRGSRRVEEGIKTPRGVVT